MKRFPAYLEQRAKKYFNSGGKKFTSVSVNNDYILLLECNNGEKDGMM